MEMKKQAKPNLPWRGDVLKELTFNELSIKPQIEDEQSLELSEKLLELLSETKVPVDVQINTLKHTLLFMINDKYCSKTRTELVKFLDENKRISSNGFEMR